MSESTLSLNKIIKLDLLPCFFVLFQIVVQAVSSLFAVMWGVLNVAGNLREIRAAAELNNIKWETQRNLPSFYIFNHRGRALAYDYIPSAGKAELENLDS